MTSNIYTLFQLCGGTFPTGGFSHSYGLETYVYDGRVKDVETFEEYLRSYLMTTIGTFEGVAFLKAYEYVELWNEEELVKLEQLLTAMKLTRESREASKRTGKALLRIGSQMMEDKIVIDYYNNNAKKGISNPIALAIISGRLNIDKEDALEGYIFATLNGLIQSGIKLIPLGNVEAQKLLYKMSDFTIEVKEKAKSLSIEEMNNFAPAFDVASMNHEILKTRLYMS